MFWWPAVPFLKTNFSQIICIWLKGILSVFPTYVWLKDMLSVFPLLFLPCFCRYYPEMSWEMHKTWCMMHMGKGQCAQKTFPNKNWSKITLVELWSVLKICTDSTYYWPFLELPAGITCLYKRHGHGILGLHKCLGLLGVRVLQPLVGIWDLKYRTT